MTTIETFNPGEFVVYPKHGLGQIKGLETQEIAGSEVRLFVIEFEEERMKLRVPVGNAQKSGLRALSSKETMGNVMKKLKGKPRVRRTMWSRRAQEYETRIKSGDPVSIAEVVRELFRPTSQAEQSYSERQIYQTALDRLAREYAAIEEMDIESASRHLEEVMGKAA